MKQAILILAHKDFAALKKLIAYFKQDCYVFVEVYVGSDNNIPEGYSVQFRLDDFEGNYMETQIPQIRNPTKVSERCGPNRQECDFSSLD